MSGIRKTARLLILGLDGATFRVIKPLCEEGKLPDSGVGIVGGAGKESLAIEKIMYRDSWQTAYMARWKAPSPHLLVLLGLSCIGEGIPYEC